MNLKEAYALYKESERALMRAQGKKDLADRVFRTAYQDYVRYQRAFVEAAEKEVKDHE